MNRDALLASLIGFGIGLLITGILLVGPNVIKGFPTIHLPTIALPKKGVVKPTPSPTPQPVTFSVTSPTAQSAVASADQVVSGTAPTSSTVVIAGPNDENVVIAGADGTFSGKITLTEGKNDIVVTSYTNGKGSSQTITVYFTKENW